MDDETLLILVAAGVAAFALAKPLSSVGNVVSDVGGIVTRPANAVYDFFGNLADEVKLWGNDERWFS